MAKGHSAKPQNIRDLRYLLEAEPDYGKAALAGISLAYATGHSEHTSKSIVRMIRHLRLEYGYSDGDILRLLSLPAKAIKQHQQQ